MVLAIMVSSADEHDRSPQAAAARGSRGPDQGGAPAGATPKADLRGSGGTLAGDRRWRVRDRRSDGRRRKPGIRARRLPPREGEGAGRARADRAVHAVPADGDRPRERDGAPRVLRPRGVVGRENRARSRRVEKRGSRPGRRGGSVVPTEVEVLLSAAPAVRPRKVRATVAPRREEVPCARQGQVPRP